MKQRGRPPLPKSEKLKLIGVCLPPRVITLLDKKMKEQRAFSRSAMLAKIITDYLQ